MNKPVTLANITYELPHFGNTVFPSLCRCFTKLLLWNKFGKTLIAIFLTSDLFLYISVAWTRLQPVPKLHAVCVHFPT